VTLQTVINSATKQVLRSGYCDFASDGSFNAGTEEVVELGFVFDPPLYAPETETETAWYWDGSTFTTTAP
jgi:hypothetical protein